MQKILAKYLNKNNKNTLHHAYLIEGDKEEILPEVLRFIESLGIKTAANSDFVQISLDSFKIEDARTLKSYAAEKGFTNEQNSKKVFIISANNFLLEAQNSLLKMFEEPIENTLFFVIVPDMNSLLRTLVSRFYVIRTRQDLVDDTKNADKFVSMPLRSRIEFIKELLVEDEEQEEADNEIVALESPRSKALKFLNALEWSLHQHFISKKHIDGWVFEHIFKVREFLRIPGSSAKTLMESVALIVPEKIK